MPRTLSLLAVLKKVDAKGVKSLSNAQWDTFLASDTEPNEIQDKIKKLEGYEEKFAAYDATGELIVEDNQAMIDRFKKKTGRAKGRESFKVKKTKINVGEFLGKDRTPDKSPDKSQNPDISKIFNDDEEKKDDVGPKGMESKLGRLSRILRDTRGRVLKLEEESKKKPNKKLVTDGLDETVNVIAEKVTSIEDSLKEQTRIEAENVKLQNQKLEDEKRDDEQTRLGKVTGFLKGAAKKIIAPVQNIFGQLFGFIKRLILGKIFLNILKWFGNPANQGKIDSVVKFLGNNWQKLLTLYIVFGTGLGRFVRFITKIAIKGAIKLAALVAQLAVARGVGGASKFAKFFGGKKGKLLGTLLQVGTATAMTVGVNNAFSGDGEEPQNFNKGGKVPGQGDKDTVPAMLTPGEFVMSKGAVQKYGVDTLEGMNAAAGGTNVPVLMPNKKRKAYNDGALVVKEDDNTISKEDKEWILSEVNKERALAGDIVSGDPLAPLKADAIKYSKDASIIKGKGKEHYFGPEKDEKIETRTNVDTMERTVICTVNGETTTKTYKLSNEQASAWLKKQGIPAMELADGTIVGDTAALAYDKSVAELANMRARLGEQSPAALAEFNALPDVIAMDKAIADGSLRKEIVTNSRKHKKGTKENLMQKNMNRILEMDGDEGVELKEHMFTNNTVTETTTDRVKYAGGGLVLGYNGGGLILKNNRVNLKHPDIDLMAPQYGLSNEQFTNVLETTHREQLRRARKKAELFASKGLKVPEVGPDYSKEQTNEMNKQWTQNRKPFEMGYEDYWNYPTVNNKQKKSGGGLMGGIKRAAGGFADYATLGMFDFDKRNRKGAPKDFGIRRIVGGLADHMTMGLTDFDKRGRGIGQFNPLFGGKDKAWGAADEQAKRGEAQSGFGLKRGIGGVMDQMTGNLFDFDKESGGGLLRKTANAISGLFGKGKGDDLVGKSDKVMGKEPKIKQIEIPAEGLESILIKIASKQDVKTPVGQPSLSGPKITVIPENKTINTINEGDNSGTQVPKFNVGYGSPRKIKQLGISR